MLVIQNLMQTFVLFCGKDQITQILRVNHLFLKIGL